MGWDRKKRGSATGYFYLSKRVPGKPHPMKVYMGRGAAGHEAAVEVERRRRGRAEAETLVRAERNPTDEADRLAVELREWAELLSAAFLILTGHHRRRSEWRKIVSRISKAGSPEWEKSLYLNPDYVRETIRSLVKRAEQGSKEAVESLHGWLKKYPDMRSLVRELDDLSTKVERLWTERLCGTDELSKKAMVDDLEVMRAELLGPAPSVTDKILVSTVLIAHLAFQRAAFAASQQTDHPEVREARERLLTIAQKRLAAAVKAWHQIAGKNAAGMRPKGKLALFEPVREAA